MKLYWIGLLTVVVLWISGVGCGGSTRGTGGVTIEGRLVAVVSLEPIAGVTVTALETGDSAISDQNGDFVIESEPGVPVSFAIEDSSFQAQVTVSDIPADAEIVTLTIELNRQEKTAQSKPTTVKKRRDKTEVGDDLGSGGDTDDDDKGPDDNGGSGGSGGTPTPTPTPGSTPTGTSTPAPTATPVPGTTPTPTDSATPTPTPEEEGTPEPARTRVDGLITSVTGNSITVETTLFLVTSSTELRDGDGKGTGISSFTIGTEVRAEGVPDALGVVTATKIEIRD